MLVLIFLYTFLNSSVFIHSLMIGSGIWSIIDVSPCEKELENVICGVKLELYKVNRTHVGFRGEIDATMDIDDTFGMFVSVCKFMDGGCKHYLDIADGMEPLLKKMSEKNIESLLRSGGVDPPAFPIPQGLRLLEGFILDYCELPTMGCIYGKYEAEAFFVKDDEYVGCIKFVLEYMQPDEEGICDK